MKNNTLIIAGLVFSTSMMSACSKTENSGNDVQLPGAVSGPENKTESVSQDPSDRNIPISQYVLFPPDADDIILTKLLIAKLPDRFPDEEKFGLLSVRYYNERDAFKKKDIADELRPNLDKELEALAKLNYMAVPIDDVPYSQRGRSVFHLSPLKVRSYSFDLKGFPLTGRYGEASCWESRFGNNQNVNVTVSGGDTPCFLAVTDEDKARAIETALQSGNVELRGMAYINLNARDRNLYGKVMHAHIELIHRITKAQLGNFDL